MAKGPNETEETSLVLKSERELAGVLRGEGLEPRRTFCGGPRPTITGEGWTRRAFLETAAVGVSATLMGCWATGCGRKLDAKVRVVVVGGGAAGLCMAVRLVRCLPRAAITLFDSADKQFYQPGFTLIAAGVYKPNDVWKRQAACIPKGVTWIPRNVVAVDPVKKRVTAEGGESADYDFLVLTPGLQVNWNLVEGISRRALGEGNAHCIYDFKGAQRMAEAMRTFAAKGGKAVFTDTYTKLKCGGAPKKVCLLTEHLLRKNGLRDRAKIDYFTASKELYDVPFYTPRLEAIYRERDIPVHLKTRVKGIDTLAKKVHLERAAVKPDGTETVESFTEEYDLLHFVPPQSAPDFVREAGLGWREGKLSREAWVEVDKHTLVHAVYPDIVSLGDVAGIPTSKTSAAIRRQVPVAVANLLSLIEGKAPEAKYDGYAACPIVTDYGHVLLCEFDYDKKPKTSFPFTLLDTSKEQRTAWWLKVYVLKRLYFYGMLKGLA